MMQYVAGVDIGNATTETALGQIEDGKLLRCVSGISATTGIKGTKENMQGIRLSLKDAAEKLGIDFANLDLIRINEATPVIGDFAMETITETIITESTLIGHNPDTPGGLGLGIGKTIRITELDGADKNEKYIVVVPEEIDFVDAARIMISPAGIRLSLISPEGVFITTADRFPINAFAIGTICFVSSVFSSNTVAIP